MTVPADKPERCTPIAMDRFVLRPHSPAPSSITGTTDPPDLPSVVDPSLFAEQPASQPSASTLPAMSAPVTENVLDQKLQALLQNLTNNIAKEVNKLAHELRGEIDQLGERTDTLETKFDDMVQYVHALEEENATLKNAVTQLQIQQEDLENRECRQNLRICGVLESIPDKEIRPYLLALFNYLAPDIPDIDWRLDRAHRSLAPKPPQGANPNRKNWHKVMETQPCF